MLATTRRAIGAGISSARMQIEGWRDSVLADRRLRDGSLRMNAETLAALKPLERVLARLEAAEQALVTAPPVANRKVVTRGLRAGLALAGEYRLAVLEDRSRLRLVDSAIRKIRAALDAPDLRQSA